MLKEGWRPLPSPTSSGTKDFCPQSSRRPRRESTPSDLPSQVTAAKLSNLLGPSALILGPLTSQNPSSPPQSSRTKKSKKSKGKTSSDSSSHSEAHPNHREDYVDMGVNLAGPSHSDPDNLEGVGSQTEDKQAKTQV